MQDSLNGTDKEQEFVETYERYVDDIYRLCFSFMKNASDAEDAVQDTFFKYYQYSGGFDSESHKNYILAKSFLWKHLKLYVHPLWEDRNL